MTYSYTDSSHLELFEQMYCEDHLSIFSYRNDERNEKSFKYSLCYLFITVWNRSYEVIGF